MRGNRFPLQRFIVKGNNHDVLFDAMRRIGERAYSYGFFEKDEEADADGANDRSAAYALSRFFFNFNGLSSATILCATDTLFCLHAFVFIVAVVQTTAETQAQHVPPPENRKPLGSDHAVARQR